MSLKAYVWAWHRDLPGITPKLVLLALADHADKTNRCYPSLTRLAVMTGIDRRSVMRALDVLEGEGVIERARSKGGSGPKSSSRYLLRLDLDGRDTVSPLDEQQGHDAPECRDADADSRGAGADQQGHGAPRTVMNQEEPSSAALPDPDGQAADELEQTADAIAHLLPERYRLNRPKLTLVTEEVA